MSQRVFISHKDSDSRVAENVARRVRYNGLDVYLDTIDSALVEDGPELADMLLERMGDCHQLIAVVSQQTKDSWWVPWEIGVGSEKGFRMASYSESYVSLPSYLEKWPALKNESHIDKYCRISKEVEGEEIRRRQFSFGNEGLYESIRKSKSMDFHRRLKSAIR